MVMIARTKTLSQIQGSLEGSSDVEADEVWGSLTGLGSYATVTGLDDLNFPPVAVDVKV
jgi:hypothetical protein